MSEDILKSRVDTGKTYELGAGCSTDGRCGEYIRCIPCNRISYHPQDIAEKWCGNCRHFHDEPQREVA